MASNSSDVTQRGSHPIAYLDALAGRVHTIVNDDYAESAAVSLLS